MLGSTKGIGQSSSISRAKAAEDVSAFEMGEAHSSSETTSSELESAISFQDSSSVKQSFSESRDYFRAFNKMSFDGKNFGGQAGNSQVKLLGKMPFRETVKSLIDICRSPDNSNISKGVELAQTLEDQLGQAIDELQSRLDGCQDEEKSADIQGLIDWCSERQQEMAQWNADLIGM